ncbi:MAG: hypothetical protein ACOY82_06630 [Pseudomonadota bacterium]
MDVNAAKRALAELDARLEAGFAGGDDRLADEERLRLLDRRSELQALLDDLEYAALPYADRVEWWSAATYRQMRWQAEGDVDQLLIFDRAWLERARRREPRILDILARVCERFDMPFARIRRLLEHEVGSPAWRAIRATLPDVDFV